MPRAMNQLKPMIIVLLMLTSALAGCTIDDRNDQYPSYEDLAQENQQMTLVIEELKENYWDMHNQLNESNSSLDELNSMIEAANNSILTLQSDLVVQQDLVTEWIVRGAHNDFSGANLSGAHLGTADLSNADLSNAYLTDAGMYDAFLNNANLTGADLTNADLRQADLTGADLTDANLSGADWYYTTCPDGTNSDDNGDTCENNL